MHLELSLLKYYMCKVHSIPLLNEDTAPKYKVDEWLEDTQYLRCLDSSHTCTLSTLEG